MKYQLKVWFAGPATDVTGIQFLCGVIEQRGGTASYANGWLAANFNELSGLGDTILDLEDFQIRIVAVETRGIHV
jgi:hypothetical protein